MKIISAALMVNLLLPFAGCANGRNEAKSLKDLTSYSTNSLLAAYEKAMAQANFLASLDQMGKSGWSSANAAKSLAAVSINGVAMHFEQITPAHMAENAKALQQQFGSRAEFWKKIGFDPKAKITASDINNGVKAMNTLMATVTGTGVDIKDLLMTSTDLKGIQSLKIAMSAANFHKFTSERTSGGLNLADSSQAAELPQIPDVPAGNYEGSFAGNDASFPFGHDCCVRVDFWEKSENRQNSEIEFTFSDYQGKPWGDWNARGVDPRFSIPRQSLDRSSEGSKSFVTDNGVQAEVKWDGDHFTDVKADFSNATLHTPLSVDYKKFRCKSLRKGWTAGVFTQCH